MRRYPHRRIAVERWLRKRLLGGRHLYLPAEVLACVEVERLHSAQICADASLAAADAAMHASDPDLSEDAVRAYRWAEATLELVAGIVRTDNF